MAMRELKHLQLELDKLTPDQLLRLAEYLIARARGERRKEAKPVDLSKFYGVIDFPEDGLEYQHRVRAEWDR